MDLPNQELPIIISLFLFGLTSGFSHCVFMCGPFVITQTHNRLKNTPSQNYNFFTKLKGIALLPYHLGRITTYCFLAAISSFLAQNLRNQLPFKYLSFILLIIAAFIFINILLQDSKLNILIKLKQQLSLIKLPKKTKLQRAIYSKFSLFLKIKTIKQLLENPVKFKGYLLGIILGFIPCGAIYASLAYVSYIENPLYAAFAMLAFGIGTIPSLLICATGGKLILTKIKILFKLVTLANIIFLIKLAFNII